MSTNQNSELEKRIRALEDEQAIRNVVATFADAVTRADYAEIPNLFDPSCTFKINHPANASCKGIGETMALLNKLRTGKDFFAQFIHSGVIHVDGDVAEARFIVHEMGMKKPTNFYNTYVTASDKFKRLDGKWIFTERSFDYMWLDTSEFGGTAFQLPSLKSI